MCNCIACKPPIIIGGFDASTVGWYILLVLYMCLTVYAFAALISAKKRDVKTESDENTSPTCSVSLSTSKDANGNPCWNAISTDIEGVVGVGTSPAEAVDNLLSRIDKQRGFEDLCSVEKEGEKGNNA